MTDSPPKRCIFFDRDGVVNVSPGKGYVLSWQQFEFTPGIQDILAKVKQMNWRSVLVTSQRGVGKGLMTALDLQQIHRQMQSRLALSNASFDAIYAYTEIPECRHRPKPDPEMLYTASKELSIELSQSWIVGDSDRDILMGRAANLKGCIRFLSDKNPEVDADHTVSDTIELRDLLKKIL